MVLVATELDRAMIRISQIAQANPAIESVGLIVESTVLPLRNLSETPESGFAITPASILDALADQKLFPGVGFEWEDVILWHTHPAGGVGPSRVDLANKVPHLQHLVVSITPDGPVPTWY